MAKGLHKTLEEINRKLEKLDAIQTTVNDVQASLQKLEGRIHKLECSQTTTNRDTENLTENFKAVEKQQQKSETSLQDHQEKPSLALTDLQKANDDLQAKLKEIEDKNLYLEAYSRRENIIFENSPSIEWHICPQHTITRAAHALHELKRQMNTFKEARKNNIPASFN